MKNSCTSRTLSCTLSLGGTDVPVNITAPSRPANVRPSSIKGPRVISYQAPNSGEADFITWNSGGDPRMGGLTPNKAGRLAHAGKSKANKPIDLALKKGQRSLRKALSTVDDAPKTRRPNNRLASSFAS